MEENLIDIPMPDAFLAKPQSLLVAHPLQVRSVQPRLSIRLVDIRYRVADEDGELSFSYSGCKYLL